MSTKTEITEICPTTTQERVKNGALLVDVREKEEVDNWSYDVTNIINIPLSEFENRFSEIPRDKEVIIVCKGGGRSLRATNFLLNHGYSNVVNMQNGLIGWEKKGFPTKGTNVPSEKNSDCCSSGDCC